MGQRNFQETAAPEQADEEMRRLNEALEKRIAQRATELAANTIKLEESERRFHVLVESVTDYAIYMLDPMGRVLNWNPGAERLKGYKRDEIIGRSFSTFYTDADRQVGVPETALATAVRTGKYEAEGLHVRKDGSTFWASVVIKAIRDSNHELVGFAKVTRDLTDRRNAEERLQQARKMEAVGQLTGGVAHDFNNLLTVVIGNLESIKRHLHKPAPDLERLERLADNAMRGALRAETVTQRLLAFSRRQPLQPKPVDISGLVTGMSDLLRRTIGERVSIETTHGDGLWRAEVDPNQLEVAILNLAVNARDAMPESGRLTIETANIYFDESYAAAQKEIRPGHYVMVALTDNGSGMTPEVIAQAFDPFFTTKDIGQGTGLGLSQVYGFVKQSGGHVKIDSEPGEGTTVRLYLPRHQSGEVQWHPQTASQAIPRSRGSETVLVVEDEPDVRNYTSGILRDFGYQVLESANGNEALEALKNNPDVRMLFTDVGLPGGMNGRQVAEEAKKIKTDLIVLFTSGYARDAIVHEGRVDAGVALIRKPFSQETLATQVRDMLDAGAPTR